VVDSRDAANRDNAIRFPKPNAGTGIRIRDGAHHTEIASLVAVRIGTFAGGNRSYKWRNRIANDLEDGIVFEDNANSNVLLDTDIGGTDRDDGEGGVGRRGLVIQSGAHSNVIRRNDRDEVPPF